MSNPFAKPAAPGDGIKWDALNGSLLLVEPLAYEEGIATRFGEQSAVRAAVAVVDGPNKGDTFPDTLVFPKVLQGQLRLMVGSKVLGRLTQGVAKSGQSAPWMLEEPTPADIQAGTEFLAGGVSASTPATSGERPF